MHEFQLIQQLKQKQYHQASLIKGVGDDAAVFRTNDDIITAVDTFVEGIHFSKKTMSYYHVGYRALAANISDMAAMGANPAYYLVSIVIPNDMVESDVHTLYDGMKALADEYKMDLIGGDTVSGEHLTISITMIGMVAKNKARYRHDARVGDIVFTTGTLGDASCGLHLLLEEMDAIDRAYFIQRHRMPTPRVAFAQALQGIKRVSLNDISDGIASELHEIAVASKVAIEIDDINIPLHPSMTQFSQEMQHQWKYFGGEDFELVGTIEEHSIDILKEAAKVTNTKISIIGKVLPYESGHSVYMKQDGRSVPLPKDGYVHLK